MFFLFKNDDGIIRSGWIIAFALAMVLLGQLIFMMPGYTFISLIETSKGNEEALMNILQTTPLYIVVTQGMGTIGGIAATLVVFRGINKKNPTKLGIHLPIKDFFTGLILGAAAITLIFFVLLITDNITLLNELTAPQLSMNLVLFLILYVLVGFFEEMFFRGYVIQTMLEHGNKKWVIYLVSAVVFGAVHFANPNPKLLGFVNIVLVGLLFAYMFDVTKSLLLPIGFHITWNYFQGTVFGFPVSGTAPYGMYDIKVSKGMDVLTGGSFGLEGGLMATIVLGFCFAFTNIYAAHRGDRLIDS